MNKYLPVMLPTLDNEAIQIASRIPTIFKYTLFHQRTVKSKFCLLLPIPLSPSTHIHTKISLKKQGKGTKNVSSDSCKVSLSPAYSLKNTSFLDKVKALSFLLILPIKRVNK